MNIFLSVMCFALVIIGAVNAGYSYNQPRPFVNQNLGPSPSFIDNPNIALPSAPVSQYTPPANGVGSFPPQQQFAPPQPISQFVPPIQQPAPAGNAGPSSSQNYNTQQQTIISKNFYVHSSADEAEDINMDLGESGPNRKNYRIVFVKAPSQMIRVNMHAGKQAINEEKTVIYILAKKPEIIKNVITSAQDQPKSHKPEVYFIKYKTQEEAQRAQQEIQAQYDALGGSTQFSDEGLAPVTSVIGSAGESNLGQSASNSQQQSFLGNHGSASSVSIDVAAPSTKYLPAQKK